MGGLISAPKDIWITIYEKGITDAQKVQKQALKLTIEGKLSAVSPNFIEHRHSPGGSHISDNKSASSTGSLFRAGTFNGGAGGSGSWTNNSGAYTAPTSTEKFSVISSFVESEWSERDRREMKSHATKLWKQYKKDRNSQTGMRPEELHELTRDSLTVLQSHISLFINNSYEEMKKHTQTCMIQLLQKYARKAGTMNNNNPSAANNAKDSATNHANDSQPGGSATGVAPHSALGSQRTNSHSGAGGGGKESTTSSSSVSSATINVNDIDWLNEQVEAEKKNMMQLLNTQIEEWIEHSVDVAEALQKMMDPHHTGQISQKTFTDTFGMAIYEIVGPAFFSKHLPMMEESQTSDTK